MVLKDEDDSLSNVLFHLAFNQVEIEMFTFPLQEP